MRLLQVLSQKAHIFFCSKRWSLPVIIPRFFFTLGLTFFYKSFISLQGILLNTLLCSNVSSDSRIVQSLQELWKQFFQISGAAAKCAVDWLIPLFRADTCPRIFAC